MNSFLAYMISGATLGFAAGIAPGPLTALVLGETLRHGRGGGVRVACAPLVTDLPIILASLALFSFLRRAEWILGPVAFAGAAYVAWLGMQSLRAREASPDLPPQPARSLRKGVVTNFLNPHPYLFWFTVGGPLTLRAWNDSGAAAATGFLAGFYGCLVGSKVAMALAADRSRRWLSGRGYRVANQLLGAALIVLALLLFRDGLRLLAHGTGGVG